VQTTSYCCGYGLQEFNFEGISNSSEDGVAGYEDFSCELQADVTAGMSYPVTAYTGDENPQDLRVYVDLDNDGSFNESELLFSSFNSTGHSGTMSFPLQVPNLETRLRMRVIADFVGNNNDGCTDTQFGQAEDYSIVIHPDTTPPAAGFTAAPLLSCDGIVSFTNNSTSYTSSLWHFGDGGTSDETEPTYTYVSEGTYTVSLVVQNDYGVDSLALVDYITVDFDAPCDTIWMPTAGTADVLTDCNGLLADDGGPDEPYSNNSSGTQTIDVGVGNTVRLEFSQFSFQFNNDFLLIYDGPNAASPLIGQYTGGALPNGGVIESSGSSITLFQLTNFFGVNPGFLLEWSCQPLGIEDLEPNLFTVYPNPTENIINIDKPADVKIVSILITDIQGRALHETALERPSLDVSFLPSGNYFLQIRTAAGNTTKPLIIR
jgi:PKD repeat protein